MPSHDHQKPKVNLPAAQRKPALPGNTVAFEDKRPGADASIQLQGMADQSPQVQQLQSYQAMADGWGDSGNGAVVQRAVDRNTLLPKERMDYDKLRAAMAVTYATSYLN